MADNRTTEYAPTANLQALTDNFGIDSNTDFTAFTVLPAADNAALNTYVKAVLKAKGIDLDSLKQQIADLQNQVNNLKSGSGSTGGGSTTPPPTSGSSSYSSATSLASTMFTSMANQTFTGTLITATTAGQPLKGTTSVRLPLNTAGTLYFTSRNSNDPSALLIASTGTSLPQGNSFGNDHAVYDYYSHEIRAVNAGTAITGLGLASAAGAIVCLDISADNVVRVGKSTDNGATFTFSSTTWTRANNVLYLKTFSNEGFPINDIRFSGGWIQS